MCSFVQAELSDNRALLQKVSGSQIARAYHQKWWYAFSLFHNKKRLFHNIGVRYRLLFSDIISISMGKEVILCELLSVMMKNPWGRY